MTGDAWSREAPARALPTCLWGPADRTPWTPCGLQGRSVGNRGHVYYDVFDFYCFAEAETAVHAGDDYMLFHIFDANFVKMQLHADMHARGMKHSNNAGGTLLPMCWAAPRLARKE